MASWKVQVHADSSGQWYDNDLRFSTKQEAEDCATAIARSWTSVTKYRVIESDDPANSSYVGGELREITPGLKHEED